MKEAKQKERFCLFRFLIKKETCTQQKRKENIELV